MRYLKLPERVPLHGCNLFENGKPLDRSDRRHYEDVASDDREVLQVRGLQVVWSAYAHSVEDIVR
jgi:hypothetical protein